MSTASAGVLTADVDFIGRAIAIQRSAARWHALFASGIVLLGLTLMVLLPLAPSGLLPDTVRGFVTLGGGFVSTLAGFPIRELYSRRNSIESLVYLRQQYEALAGGDIDDPSRAEWVRDQFRLLVQRNLGG